MTNGIAKAETEDDEMIGAASMYIQANQAELVVRF